MVEAVGTALNAGMSMQAKLDFERLAEGCLSPLFDGTRDTGTEAVELYRKVPNLRLGEQVLLGAEAKSNCDHKR